MAKFCSGCGNELPDNAAMCVKCGKLVDSNTSQNNGKNKKKKGLPVWGIVLIVVGSVVLIPIIILIVFAIIGYNVIKNDNVKEYIQDKFNYNYGTIGDTLETDDFKITLNNALTYTEIKDNYYTDTPSSGKEYLVLFFDIENISDDNEYISSYDFHGYVDGYSITPKFLLNDIDGKERIDNSIAPGKKINGYVAFEVDNTWEKFEVQFGDEEIASFSVVSESSKSNT